MRVLGLDLSLTATGVAYPDGTTAVLRAPERKLAKGGKRTEADDMGRLDWLHDAVWEAVIYEDRFADLVVIEGYSFGSSTAGARSIGELGGVIRHALWTGFVPYLVVPPKSLKKYATNNGAATKPDMLDAARRCGYEGINDDNAVDAWWLRAVGLHGATLDNGIPYTAYRAAVIATLPPIVEAPLTAEAAS